MPVNLKRFLIGAVAFAFLMNSFVFCPFAQADEFILPPAGTRIALSPMYQPALIVGMQVNPQNPFQLNFIFDPGQQSLSNQLKRTQYRQMVEYFLASLTIPNQDMWVNLSPYEKNRIIPDNFGQTRMGRDLLAQDYILKQMTSSLIYPEGNIGKEFWQKVYAQAQSKLGTTNVPINTFNKVWIVPDKADVYEKDGAVFIVSSHLKVMLEEDYLALSKHQVQPTTNTLASQVVREIVLPALEKEVNEGKNFAQLRQVYSAMLMATWFKKTLRKSILGQAYADKSKVAGINLKDTQDKERIYQEYLKAFKKGAFNFIKEDVDPLTHEAIPRKYFSGGMLPFNPAMIHQADLNEKMKFIQNAPRLRWDMAQVSLLEQFFKAQAFPTDEDRQRFAGKGHVLESATQLDEKNIDLGWLFLTNRIAVRWFKRDEKKKFKLERQKIRKAKKDTIYLYRLPEDITVREILLLIKDMQELPLAAKEKIILPQTAKRFLQMAHRLREYQHQGNGQEVQGFIKALEKIAEELGGKDITASQVEDTEYDLKELWGISDGGKIPDVQTMMARVVELGVRAVQIELEGQAFWGGENLFRRALEIDENKRKFLFDLIDLDAFKRRIARYPEGSEKSDNEKIKAIQEILQRVRALPQFDSKIRLEALEQGSPRVESLTNLLNCVGKSALAALYYNALGLEVYAADVRVYHENSKPAEHVLDLVHLSGNKFFWAEASGPEGKSYKVTLDLEADQIPAQGLVLNLNRDQNYRFKRVYIGPWHQMITAMFYSSLGVVLLGKEHPDVKGAIAAHRKAISLYPNYFSAYLNLGVALTEDNDWEGAIAAFEKAIQLEPTNNIAYDNLQILFKGARQYQRAVSVFQEVNPGNSIGYENLGYALSKSGRRQEAIATYRVAIEKDEKNAQAWSYLVAALWDNKDPKSIEDAYERMKMIDFENVNQLTDLGNRFYNMGHYEEASQIYRKCIGIEPTSMLYDHLGNALFYLDRYREAAANYRKSLDMDRNQAGTMGNLANTLFALNEVPEGQELYREAMALNTKDTTTYVNFIDGVLLIPSLTDAQRVVNSMQIPFTTFYNDLGVALTKKAKFSGSTLWDPELCNSFASEAFNRAIELDPQNAVAKNNLEILKNPAMTTPGGINLNEDLLDMHIKRDGQGMPLAFSLQDAAMLNIQGLSPLIVRVVPFNASHIQF